MHRSELHQHDAGLGAQSRGEFLGLPGDTAWLLIGAVAVSLAIFALLWGFLQFSFLGCLLGATSMCGLCVAYVMFLKRNRPAHYDSDFFESVLVEAHLIPLRFGPRSTRLPNPFTSEVDGLVARRPLLGGRRSKFTVLSSPLRSSSAKPEASLRATATSLEAKQASEVESLQTRVNDLQEQLDDASEGEGDE